MAGRSGYWDLTIHHNKPTGPTLPGTFDYDGQNPVNVNITNSDSNYETNWYTPVGTDLEDTKIHWNIPTVNYNEINYTVSDVTIITTPVEDLIRDVQVIAVLNQTSDFSWNVTIRHSCSGKNFTITASRSGSTILNKTITTSNQTFSLGVTSESSIKNSITWAPTQIVEGIYTYNFTFSVTENLFSFTTINPAILNIYGEQNTSGGWKLTKYCVSAINNTPSININNSDTQAITLSYNGNNQTVNFTHGNIADSFTSINSSLVSSYINALSSTDATADIAFINNMTYSPTLYYKNDYKIQLGGIYFTRYTQYDTAIDVEFIQTNTGYWSIKLKRNDSKLIKNISDPQYINLCFTYDNVTLQYVEDGITNNKFTAYTGTYTTIVTNNLYSELSTEIDINKIWWKVSSQGTWYKLSNNLSSTSGINYWEWTIEQFSNGNPIIEKVKWDYKYRLYCNSLITPWSITEETHDYTLAVTLTQQLSGQVGQWKLTSMVISPTTGVSGITNVIMPITITANSISKQYNIEISGNNQAENYQSSVLIFGTTAIGTNISQPTYSASNYSVVYNGVRHIFRITNVTFTRTPLTYTDTTVTLTLTQVSGGGWVAAIKHNLASGITLNMTFTRNSINFTRNITSSLVSNLSTGWTTAEGTAIYLAEISYNIYIVGSNNTLYRVNVTYSYQTYGESKRIAINSISIEYTATQSSPIPASGGTAYPYSVDVNYTKWIDYSNGNPSTNAGTVSDTLYYSGGDFDLYYDVDKVVTVDSKVDAIDSGNNPTLVVHSGNSGRTDYTRVTFDVVWGGDTISVTSDDVDYYIYQEANKCTTSTSSSSSTEDVTVNAYAFYDNVNYSTVNAYIDPSSGSFTAAGTPSTLDVTGYEKYTYQKRERGRFRLDTITTTTTNYTYTSTYSWSKTETSTSQGTPRYEYRTLSTVYTSGWEEFRSDVHQRSNNTSGLTFNEGSDAHITASSLGTTYIPSSKTLVCYYHPYSGTEPTATFTQAANTYTVSTLSNEVNTGWQYNSWTTYSYYHDFYIDWNDYDTFNADGTVVGNTSNTSIQILAYYRKWSGQRRLASQVTTTTPRWTYNYASGESEIKYGNSSTSTTDSYYEYRNGSNSTEEVPVSLLSSGTGSGNYIYDSSRFDISNNAISADDITNSQSSVDPARVRAVILYTAANNPYANEAISEQKYFYQLGYNPSVEEQKTYITDVNIYASSYSGTLSGDNETISAAGGWVDMTAEIAYEIRTYVNGTLTNTSSTYYKYVTSGFTKQSGDSNITLSGNRVSAPNRGSSSGAQRSAIFRYQYSLGSGEYVDNSNTLIDTLTIYQEENTVSMSTTPGTTQRNVVRTGSQVHTWYFHEELNNVTITPGNYFTWNDPPYNPFLVDIEIDYYSPGYIQFTYNGVNTYTYTSNTVTTNNYSYNQTTYENIGYITESEIADWIYFANMPNYISVSEYGSDFANEIDGDGNCSIYHKTFYISCNGTVQDSILGWVRADGQFAFSNTKTIQIRPDRY